MEKEALAGSRAERVPRLGGRQEPGAGGGEELGERQFRKGVGPWLENGLLLLRPRTEPGGHSHDLRPAQASRNALEFIQALQVGWAGRGGEGRDQDLLGQTAPQAMTSSQRDKGCSLHS